MNWVKDITITKDGYDIAAIRPPDATFKKMLAAHNACKEAGVEPPSGVSSFFDDGEPDPQGTEVELKHKIFENEWDLGFQVDVKDIPKWATHIRFTVTPDC